MARRIAMVGTAPSGTFAPFDNPDWEIWGCSARGPHVSHADRWFELHRLDGEEKEWADNWRKTIKDWLNEQNVTLYMFYPESDLSSNVIQYPTDQIVPRFGTFFMTSTFSWMMALAINEMAPVGTMAEPGAEIALYGVDMEYGTEYREQRFGLRHFISLAKQLGIRVTLVAGGGLVYEPVPYPLWQDDPLLCKLSLRNQGVIHNIQQFDAAVKTAEEQLYRAEGALAEIELATMDVPFQRGEDDPPPPYDPDVRIEALNKQIEQLRDTGSNAAKALTHWRGVDSEQKWLKDYLLP